LLLGRRTEARTLVDQQLRRPGAAESRTRGSSLRLLAATSDLEERPGLLQKAVDLLEASQAKFELACTLAELSRTFHSLGEFKRARGALHRSMHMADTCHARTFCQRLLARQGDPLEVAIEAYGPSTLSEAERRVAVLAAFGHSNREIGQKLHITVSTVEQHLTRVYRKLEINRRTELVSRMRPDVVKSA
jgi:DNA-binding CsgD family transcriptional regulator